MANQHRDDGHFTIANAMAEALARISFAPNEARVLWAIWRKTYGWHKAEDAISLSQLRSLTWLQKPHIIRSLRSLERRRILVVTRTGNKNAANMYRFNQNYDQWVVAAVDNNSYIGQEQKVVADTGNDDVVTAAGNKLLPVLVPTKDTATKDINNKDRKEIYKEKTEKSARKLNKELKESLKKAYGEFKNVRLTDEEYAKLTTRFTDALDRIESLSAYKKSRNKHYADDYATILNWSRRENDSIEKTRRRGDIPDYTNYHYENPPL